MKWAFRVGLLATVAWHVVRLFAGKPELDATWTASIRVEARDGRLLGERPSSLGLYGRSVPLSEISPRLVEATLASEDRRFFDHDGVDPLAVSRALLSLVVHRRIISGGSTLTTQLVKRLDHQGKPRPRTFGQKWREMLRAENLERTFDKDTLLAAYFDHLDYGRGLVGPEAAARGWFGVPAKDLSLAQAALLAVLPRAPSALDPIRHRERAIMRQRELLERMKISPEDRARALAEPLVVHAPVRPLFSPQLVLASAKKNPQPVVRTTLDLDLQRDVEGLAKTHVERLQDRHATAVAVVVVDNANGEVLASVGTGEHDLVHAPRQAGSTLKPFIYARAFERGVSPMAMLADVPFAVGRYTPTNFDGTYTGPVAAREALAGSLNIPAVRLAMEEGPEDLVQTLRRLGLPLPGGAERFGLSIALGSGEVTPMQLAEAYSTLARGGEHVTLHSRPVIGESTHVLDAASVASVADALSDPLARVRGLRTRGPFELPFPTAIKTGTSTAYRDGWTAGFTHERTVVVWVGNPDGTAMHTLTGAAAAGPLFSAVMKRAMNGIEPAPLYAEHLLERAEVCALSGERPGPACTDHVSRLLPHAPTHTCTLHRKHDVALPAAYAGWLDPGHRDLHGIPWVIDREATGAEPRITIAQPENDAELGGAIDVAVETEGLPTHEPLEVLMDGRVMAALSPSYRTRLEASRGVHLIEVRPRDPSRAVRLGRARVVSR